MPTTRQLLVRHNVLPSFDKSYFTPKLAALQTRTSDFMRKTHSSSFKLPSSSKPKAKHNSLGQWGYVSEVKPDEDEIRLTGYTTGETIAESR
jgi:hypothetical protein